MSKKNRLTPETEHPPIFQRVSTYLLLLPVVFALGLVSGYLIWGYKPAEDPRLKVAVDNDPSIGPEDAPVVIIEFSDYQCPYCKRWHEQVFERLMVNYPDQIRFVYRDYPLPGHPEAEPAAEAANCAGEQGAFWQFHDAIFTYQADLSRDTYLQIAASLVPDVQAFTECLDSRRFAAEIQEDYKYGASLGVRATPTFFINGYLVEGALPYEAFQQYIDQALAGKLPQGQ